MKLILYSIIIFFISLFSQIAFIAINRKNHKSNLSNEEEFKINTKIVIKILVAIIISSVLGIITFYVLGIFTLIFLRNGN